MTPPQAIRYYLLLCELNIQRGGGVIMRDIAMYVVSVTKNIIIKCEANLVCYICS